jgi:hypothetical protein
MQRRPRKKKVKHRRFPRCPKCRKLVGIHQNRCKTCHQVLRA